MADFKYEIVEHIGTLSESAKGWTKELNKISWNGGEPKYDIRDWAPEHEKMGKGVTLSEEEMVKLRELLQSCSSFLQDVTKELKIVIGNTKWQGDESWWISLKEQYDAFSRMIGVWKSYSIALNMQEKILEVVKTII